MKGIVQELYVLLLFLPRLGETAPLCCMACDVSSVLVVPCTSWAGASSAQCCGHILWATAITALASSAENSDEFQMLLLVNVIYLHSLHLIPWDLTDISPQNVPPLPLWQWNECLWGCMCVSHLGFLGGYPHKTNVLAGYHENLGGSVSEHPYLESASLPVSLRKL